jgi:transposase
MKKNKIEVKRNAYGELKNSVYDCCMQNMTAKEIAVKLNTTPHTVYSVAKRMCVNPKAVYHLNKKFKHGGLTKAIIECCYKKMTVRQIADKLQYSADTISSIARKYGFKPSKDKVLVLNT